MDRSRTATGWFTKRMVETWLRDVLERAEGQASCRPPAARSAMIASSPEESSSPQCPHHESNRQRDARFPRVEGKAAPGQRDTRAGYRAGLSRRSPPVNAISTRCCITPEAVTSAWRPLRTASSSRVSTEPVIAVVAKDSSADRVGGALLGRRRDHAVRRRRDDESARRWRPRFPRDAPRGFWNWVEAATRRPRTALSQKAESAGSRPFDGARSVRSEPARTSKHPMCTFGEYRCTASPPTATPALPL